MRGIAKEMVQLKIWPRLQHGKKLIRLVIIRWFYYIYIQQVERFWVKNILF